MDETATTAFVGEILQAFAERTGLTGVRPPTRYLWTDAFAVCGFLGLERRTGDSQHRQLALRLVDQVHHILGRHRADDPRTGWISGLGEAEGELQPTRGGLRIGKALNERRPDEPMNERLEWDRDGQYFHYLTRWMHALVRLGRVTGDANYIRWATELAATAYDRFTYVSRSGGARSMYWKMSIDLSRPLVAAMGQHDPLDGLVAFLELRFAAEGGAELPPIDLDARIAGLAAMCTSQRLATADPLGIGALLTAAHTLAQLSAAGTPGYAGLLIALLDQALPGLADQLANQDALSLPPEYRLAFRELGLSIGLRALKRIQELIDQIPAAFESVPSLRPGLEGPQRFLPLIEAIEGFWLEPANRQSATWREHEDINAVMLATSLAPEGYLAL